MKDLLVIIVLYKTLLEKSPSFISLAKVLPQHGSDFPFCLIYDNSPDKQFDCSNTTYTVNNIPIHYIHNNSNPGISRAYNKGLEFAQLMGKRWMLLLDQDSILPSNYIENFFTSFEKYNTNNIVAYVPKVIANNHIISPAKVKNNGRVILVKKEAIASCEGQYSDLSSINSGVFIDTNFMITIGGFSLNYPLDMLDHWLFKHIALRKYEIVVMPIYIDHDLSLSSKNGISTDRYIGILNAEKTFLSEFGSLKDQITYRIRLVLRFFSQIKNRHYKKAKMTIEYMLK